MGVDKMLLCMTLQGVEKRYDRSDRVRGVNIQVV